MCVAEAIVSKVCKDRMSNETIGEKFGAVH